MEQKIRISILVENKKFAGFIFNESEIDKESQLLLMKLLRDVEIIDVHEVNANWEKMEAELASKNETVNL